MAIVNVKVPSVGESVQEGMVHSWNFKTGDFVQQDDVLAELETDKATVEIVSEASGQIEILKNKGESVNIGDILATIDTDASPSAKASEDKKADDKAPAPVKAVEKAPEKKSEPTREGIFSPAAKKIAAEHGLEGMKSGTGRGGRITKEDVLEKISTPTKETPVSKPAPKLEMPAMTGAREIRREKMSMIRKTIAKHLVNSQQTAAMLTTFNDVDMSRILDLRKKYKDPFKEKHGISLGFMGFFLMAAAEALKEFPQINAFIEGDELVYHNYCDIGVAVSTERGLMVPVVRNVEKMNILQIEQSVAALAQKGRDGKISLDDLSGGTFTVSNGGVFGSLMSTPILNSPQSGILGMHRIDERPVVVDGQIVARPMMYLALSYDHRIVDGKEAVQFLVKIKQCIEDPNRLLIGV